MKEFQWLVVVAVILQVTSGKPSSPRDLTYDLLKDYLEEYRDARPVNNHTEKLDLKFGVALIRIKQLYNSDTGTGIFQFFLRYMWRDSNLTWDPKDYDGQAVAYISPSKIWTPDIRLYNGFDEEISMGKAHVVVYSTGDVLWVPPVTVRVPCKKLGYFTNQYTCSFKFGSWAYDGNKLDPNFYEGVNQMDMSDYASKYTILENEAVKNVKYYPCCEEPYPDLTFHLRIKG
jgi:hypothetical protein